MFPNYTCHYFSQTLFMAQLAIKILLEVNHLSDNTWICKYKFAFITWPEWKKKYQEAKVVFSLLFARSDDGLVTSSSEPRNKHFPFGPRATEEPQELQTNSKNEDFHAHIWQEKAMAATVIPTEDEIKQSSFHQDAQLQ